MTAVDSGDGVAVVGDRAVDSPIQRLKILKTSHGLHGERKIDLVRVPYLSDHVHILDLACSHFCLVASRHGRGYNYRDTEHAAQAVEVANVAG